MAMTSNEVIEFINRETFAIVVTNGKNGMTSRTMTYGFLPSDKMFMMTHIGTPKLDDISHSGVGLMHISKIETDITQSTDVSLEGTFEVLGYEDPLYKKGVELLGLKNPQITDILADETTRNQYAIILLSIRHMSGWNYLQALSGEPKTILI
jgi:hypothetical protein